MRTSRKGFRALCLLVGVLCSFTPRAARASVDAAFDGLGIIKATDTGNQDLTVLNPDTEHTALVIKKYDDFIIIQGGQDTRRTVNLRASRDPKHQVANIDVPDTGDLVYHVTGIIYRPGAGVGPGGKLPTWTADYNRGVARIVLEVNQSGSSDDVVVLGDNGGTLYVCVANASGTIPVKLSANPSAKLSNVPADSDNPNYVSINVEGGSTPTTFALNGQANGQVTITASATVNNQNISASITANVLAYRGKLIPRDRFVGRSYQRVGVGETGTLGVEGTDANLNAAKPLRWSVTNGTAITIANETDDGTATFTAGDAAGPVTLTLTDKTSSAIDYCIAVVEPASETAFIVGDGEYANDIRIAGMRPRVYLHPTDVSFANVKVREVSGDSTDFAGDFEEITTHRHNASTEIPKLELPGNVSDDNVECNCGTTNLQGGHISWNVPVQWQISSGTGWDNSKPVKTLPDRVMRFETSSDQTVTVRKLGKWESRKLTNSTIDHN
jgi:hypothetical protein